MLAVVTYVYAVQCGSLAASMDGVHPVWGLPLATLISRTHDHGLSQLHVLFKHMLYSAAALATFQLTSIGIMGWIIFLDNPE
jgi:hypothetical protein